MNPWPTKKLGEVCEVLDSRRKPVTRRDRKSGLYPYYGATGIQDYVSSYIFDEDLILIGEDGARWGSGENTAFLATGKYWVNNHAHVIRPHRHNIVDNWLIYFLNSSDLSEYITGTTVKKLNQEKLRSIPIPLPPLEIQKKVVKKIEGLFAKIAQAQSLRESATKDLNSFISASIHQALKKMPIWQEKRFGDIMEVVTKRTTKTDLPYVGMEDVSTGGTAEFYGSLRPQAVKSMTFHFDHNHVLYGKLRPYLNKILVPQFEGHCTTEFLPLRPNGKLLTREWLALWLRSQDTVNKIMTTTTGTRMPRAGMKRVKDFIIPLPPISEQKGIVARMDALTQKVRQLKILQSETATNLTALKQSILHKAFQGEL